MIASPQANFNALESNSMAKKKEVIIRSLSGEELDNELRKVFTHSIFGFGFLKNHLIEKLAEAGIMEVSDEELEAALWNVLKNNYKPFRAACHGSLLHNDDEITIKLNLFGFDL